MPFRTLRTTFAHPERFDDDQREGADYEYDEFACLDANTCSNDGGCVYLTQCGVTRCMYCKAVVA